MRTLVGLIRRLFRRRMSREAIAYRVALLGAKEFCRDVGKKYGHDYDAHRRETSCLTCEAQAEHDRIKSTLDAFPD